MNDFLKNLSDGMADAVSLAGASVVQVNARRRMPTSGIVWSADGLIVTAHHGVEHEDRLRVGLPDGSSVNATLVGRDPNTDLALLRTDSALTAPTWAELGDVRVGNLALAVARPGDHLQTTLGVISALHQGEGDNKFFAQTDVVMYPGFSGGALVSASGTIIGLNTSGLMGGASLTVQTPTVRYVVESLLQHGKMRRGFLGVGVQPARLPDALAESVGQKGGALIVSVEPNSPAEKAGLYLGDTIVSMGSARIGNMQDLLGALANTAPGATLVVKIVRGGQVVDLNAEIGERT